SAGLEVKSSIVPEPESCSRSGLSVLPGDISASFPAEKAISSDTRVQQGVQFHSTLCLVPYPFLMFLQQISNFFDIVSAEVAALQKLRDNGNRLVAKETREIFLNQVFLRIFGLQDCPIYKGLAFLSTCFLHVFPVFQTLNQSDYSGMCQWFLAFRIKGFPNFRSGGSAFLPENENDFQF